MITPSQTVNEEGIVNADFIPLVGGDGYEAVADPDFETLFVDGSIVRVHQHGAGEKKTATGKPLGAAGVA